jgi:hypothetical protein
VLVPVCPNKLVPVVGFVPVPNVPPPPKVVLPPLNAPNPGAGFVPPKVLVPPLKAPGVINLEREDLKDKKSKQTETSRGSRARG